MCLGCCHINRKKQRPTPRKMCRAGGRTGTQTSCTPSSGSTQQPARPFWRREADHTARYIVSKVARGRPLGRGRGKGGVSTDPGSHDRDKELTTWQALNGSDSSCPIPSRPFCTPWPATLPGHLYVLSSPNPAQGPYDLPQASCLTRLFQALCTCSYPGILNQTLSAQRPAASQLPGHFCLPWASSHGSLLMSPLPSGYPTCLDHQVHGAATWLSPMSHESHPFWGACSPSAFLTTSSSHLTD